jgi:hypothetical protein
MVSWQHRVSLIGMNKVPMRQNTDSAALLGRSVEFSARNKHDVARHRDLPCEQNGWKRLVTEDPFRLEDVGDNIVAILVLTARPSYALEARVSIQQGRQLRIRILDVVRNWRRLPQKDAPQGVCWSGAVTPQPLLCRPCRCESGSDPSRESATELRLSAGSRATLEQRPNPLERH